MGLQCLTRLLHGTFLECAELDHAVVVLDEVEETASLRCRGAPWIAGLLLVSATNFHPGNGLGFLRK